MTTIDIQQTSSPTDSNDRFNGREDRRRFYGDDDVVMMIRWRMMDKMEILSVVGYCNVKGT